MRLLLMQFDRLVMLVAVVKGVSHTCTLPFPHLLCQHAATITKLRVCLTRPCYFPADRIIDDTAADAIDAVSETADATQQRMQVRLTLLLGCISGRLWAVEKGAGVYKVWLNMTVALGGSCGVTWHNPVTC